MESWKPGRACPVGLLGRSEGQWGRSVRGQEQMLEEAFHSEAQHRAGRGMVKKTFE